MLDMNIEKLEVGMKVKNYKVLCELLDMKVTNFLKRLSIKDSLFKSRYILPISFK